MIQEYKLLLILIFLISQINSQLFNTVSIIKSRAVDIKLPRQLNHSVLHLIHPNDVFFPQQFCRGTTHTHTPTSPPDFTKYKSPHLQPNQSYNKY